MYNGPDKQKETLRNALRQRQLAAHEQWRKLAAGLGPSAAETFREYERAAQELGVVSNSAAFRVKQLREDDLLPDAGRRRLISDALSEGAKKRDAARARMRTAREVLAAKARAAAMPKLDPKREAAAREELRLLTGGTNDPADVLLELAKGDDELAAVSVSSYSQSLLRAKGVRKAPELHKAVQDVAVHTARRSADPKRRAAASAYSALGELDRAMACSESLAEGTLEDLGVELG
ncbi:MAG: hypothetical protein GX537_06665 [Actinobacteria bacterium]|nr:hypothetical protein [Actinomycetota bacterium]